jgi:LuxR family maltose regulon positive regulatory protein
MESVFMNQPNNFPGLPQLILPRPQLMQRLAQASKRKLTLVSAPAGYGKTTFIVQFAQQTLYPVLWHTVEAAEYDAINLHQHCLSVLGHVFPNLHDVAFRIKVSAGEQASHLNEVLGEQEVQQDLFYVLDDAQHLLGSPASESWLRAWIETLPDFLHVILISRAIPTLPLTDMIAHGELLGIGQEELRFSSDEVQQLADQTHLAVASDALQALVTRLDGWPAGTVLALQPLPKAISQAVFETNNGPEALFDMLAQRTLAAQPPLLQDFLMAASTLNRLTPERCQETLKLPESQKRIAEALARNLFLTRVPGGLTFHPLFRDFLQRQFQSRDPAHFQHLHRRAALWFEKRLEYDLAFEHYLAGGMVNEVGALVEQLVQTYFSQGRTETLLRWSRQLGAAVTQTPRLLYACAMIHTDRYQYDLAATGLEQAQAGFEQAGDAVGGLKVQLLQAYIANQQGRYTQAKETILPLLDNPDLPDNLRGWAFDILGTAYLQQGEPETALQHYETALPLYQAVGDAYSTSQVLQNMELAYLRYGRFEEAERCLQEIVVIRRRLGGALGLALALNDLGYHYHQQGYYQQALLTFQEGLSLTYRQPEHRAESYLRWSFGDLQRDRGLFAEATQHYHKALELTGDREPALRCSLLVSLSTLLRWQDRLEEARLLAQDALDLAGQHQTALEQSKAALALSAASINPVDLETVQQRLETLAEQFAQQRNYTRLSQALGIAAAVALRRSDPAAAHRCLSQALQTIPHPVHRQPLIAEIQHTSALRTFLRASAARYAPLVAELERLEAHSLQPADSAEPDGTFLHTSYSLQVFTLGQERVVRDGAPLASTAWPSVVARHLFFYLLFHGPSTREHISLAFWPDSSPEQVRRNFHISVYRARQAVGENTILYQDERYLINPDFEVWVDAQELEKRVQQARLLPPRAAHTEHLWQQAVDLYQGEFLGSIDHEWVAAGREKLQDAYLEAWVGLGQCARARGRPDEAVRSFKQALMVDPYREDIHRLILTCYAEQGEKHQVAQHWSELRRLLRQELAVEPSPETLYLARTLLA